MVNPINSMDEVQCIRLCHLDSSLMPDGFSVKEDGPDINLIIGGIEVGGAKWCGDGWVWRWSSGVNVEMASDIFDILDAKQGTTLNEKSDADMSKVKSIINEAKKDDEDG